MATWLPFLAVFIAQFAHQRLVLRYGQANLLEILHGTDTWCVVYACLFSYLKNPRWPPGSHFRPFLLHNLHISALISDVAVPISLKFCMVFALGV